PDATIRSGAAAAAGTLVAFAVQDLASFTVASTGVLAAAGAGWASGNAGVPAQGPSSRDARGAPAHAIGLGAAAGVWAFLVLFPWLADTDDGPHLDRVRSEFARAIALEPENANVLELAAQGYLDLGLTGEARAAALRCAALFPDYAMPISDLGVASLLEGRPDAAADTLTLALQRNWHGEEGAAMAAKSNYVAALRELRLRDLMKGKKR